MGHKPAGLTMLCEILRHKNVEFMPLYNRLAELSPSYPDDGDFRKLSYNMGDKRYSIKTGRFLTKRLRGVVDLSAMEVQQIAAEINLALHGKVIEVYTGSGIYAKYVSLGINSCMALGKVPPERFAVYANNPNVVSLAVCYTSQGAARCLIWKANDVTGAEQTLYDRRYASCEKARKELEEWCKERGYKDVYGTNEQYTVAVKDEYDTYPYMDTFAYLSEGKKILSTHMTGMSWTARSTAGRLSPIAVSTVDTLRPRVVTAEPEDMFDENDEQYWHCSDCGEDCYENDLHEECSSQNVIMCEECFERHFIKCCCCDEWLEHHETYAGPGGDGSYCNECFNEHYTICNDCGEPYAYEYGHWLEHLERDVCDWCYDNNYKECEECDEAYPEGDVETFEDGDGEEHQFCPACAKNVDYCDKCGDWGQCHELVDSSIVCEKCHPVQGLPGQLNFTFGESDQHYFTTVPEYRHHAALCKAHDLHDLLQSTLSDMGNNFDRVVFGNPGAGKSVYGLPGLFGTNKGLKMGRGPLEIMWPREDGYMIINSVKSEHRVGPQFRWENYAVEYRTEFRENDEAIAARMREASNRTVFMPNAAQQANVLQLRGIVLDEFANRETIHAISDRLS